MDRMTRFAKLLTCAVSLAASARAEAQACQPHWSDQFGWDAPVTSAWCMETLDLGGGPGVYLGGQFWVSRWDGGEWSGLGYPNPSGYLNGYTRALAVHDDGTGRALYVGGDFFSTSPQIPQVTRVARWTGSTWAPVGGGVDFIVRDLFTHDDGSGSALYALGATYKHGATGPSAFNGLARWDGAAWYPAFGGVASTPNSGLAGGFDATVFDDGSGPFVIVCGLFTSAGGVPVQNIARWTGAGWAPLGAGLSGATPSLLYSVARALVVFDEGTGPALYVGGAFLTAGGQPAPYVAKWDGVQWAPSGDWSAVGTTPATEVHRLLVHDDGEGPHVYAALSRGASGCVVRLAGGAWEIVDGGCGSDVIRGLASLRSGAGPSLLAAGSFQGWLTNPPFSAWYVVEHAQGLWRFPGYGTDGHVYAVESYDDGSGETVYVGGTFTRAHNVIAPGVAAYDGSTWRAIPDTLGDIYAFRVLAAGGAPQLFAAGWWSGPPPQLEQRGWVARWTGADWDYFGHPGPDARVRDLELFDDGSGPKVFAAGSFSPELGLFDRRPLARWDGNQWSYLGLVEDFHDGSLDVRCCRAFDDGSGLALYVGGNFINSAGQVANCITRWNGTAWSPVGPGFLPWVYPGGQLPPSIHALEVFDDGTGPALYAGGGGWNQVAGTHMEGIAKWDGVEWRSIGASGGVTDLKVYDAGDGSALWAAGNFTQQGGLPANRVAKWDGRNWSALGTGIGPELVSSVTGFNAPSGPSLVCGGMFTKAGGLDSAYIAQWQMCTTGACYPDCDKSGSLALPDFTCFQTKFVAADPYADCNADGSLTVADFGCFQTKFVVGCP